MKRRPLWLTACVLAPLAAFGADESPKMPMRAGAEDSAARRWLGKEVLASKVVADMEDLGRWKVGTWAGGKGEIALTAERAKDGKHSLRFRSRTKGEKASADGGVFGATSAVRAFGGADWSPWNRISFWVWPDLPGHHAVALSVRLGNRGKRLGRDTHHVLLKDRQWNHVVWEIPDLARDHVTELAFTYVMNGSEAGAAEVATFDIDRLELQRVEADPYEGWNVAPGRIAYSHTGYLTGGRKTAVVSGAEAAEFELLRLSGPATKQTRPIRTITGRTGTFGVLDFSDVTKPGTYRLRVGTLESRPFEIGDRVWDGTIWKAINFFYVERCGCAIPGVHGVCHADWFGEHDGKRIVINGGWHDAGDLSQGLINTSEAAYAMFDLAARLGETGGSDALRKRLIEEARWGLDWVMKTRFRDGYRIEWATHRFWTDNKAGTIDDVTAKARSNWPISFYAAAVEALAARVLKAEDAQLADKALAIAREDWGFAVEGLAKVGADRVNVEHAGIGALASLELYRTTGERRYADKAVALARGLVASQQREVPEGLETPITGFFYRTQRKQSPMRYRHRGHEQAPIVALAGLCEALPDHADWMDWYAAVVLHSEYCQKAMAQLTAPYDMLPNSLHHVDEHKRAGKDTREAIREQITAGFDVGGGWYVRTYAVHPRETFRGNYGTMLSQAKAVATAGRLRRNGDLIRLARQQLRWVVGRNPFGQSTMYGEGHDWAPQYTARSGDIVGSLPVGMKSLANRDLPYWPFTNVWNYKEVWVHPVSRWLWLMCDLRGPGTARGMARPAGALDLQLAHETKPGGEVALALTATGAGRHRFAVRAANLTVPQPETTIDLKPREPRTIEWRGKVASPRAPWVVLIVPDGKLADRVEGTGVARE